MRPKARVRPDGPMRCAPYCCDFACVPGALALLCRYVGGGAHRGRVWGLILHVRLGRWYGRSSQHFGLAVEVTEVKGLMRQDIQENLVRLGSSRRSMLHQQQTTRGRWRLKLEGVQGFPPELQGRFVLISAVSKRITAVAGFPAYMTGGAPSSAVARQP